MPRTRKHGAPPPLYDVHPGVVMVQNWIATLPEKTGRSLEEWIRLVQKEGPADEKERREWLKRAHQFGTNSAWWLAERAAGRGDEEDDPEKYLQAAAAGWIITGVAHGGSWKSFREGRARRLREGRGSGSCGRRLCRPSHGGGG